MLEAMAFWIDEPGVGALRRHPIARAGDGDVLVRTSYTGISRGTEASVFLGRVPISEGNGRESFVRASPHRSMFASRCARRAGGGGDRFAHRRRSQAPRLEPARFRRRGDALLRAHGRPLSRQPAARRRGSRDRLQRRERRAAGGAQGAAARSRARRQGPQSISHRLPFDQQGQQRGACRASSPWATWPKSARSTSPTKTSTARRSPIGSSGTGRCTSTRRAGSCATCWSRWLPCTSAASRTAI